MNPHTCQPLFDNMVTCTLSPELLHTQMTSSSSPEHETMR